jgi:predicted KAP-like P-loop ATPase
VGIYGEWGLGKTTLLNFVEHHVRADPDADDPIVIRFNPWWFSGRDDLLRCFFEQFTAAVSERPAKLRQVAENASRLAKFFGRIPSSAVDAVAPGAGAIVSAAAELLDRSAPLSPSDFAKTKRQLELAMAATPLRILVIVDDVDRLPPREMVDVFRLVKAVGDLPNVIYLLALDRAVVESALCEQYGQFGASYLEKIVQVSFDLPRPPDGALGRLFATRLHAVLASAPKELFDEARWRALYEGGVEAFLRTPRDVARLLNTVSVTYPAVRAEVNPVDFVGIEALRLFQPLVYDTIRSHPEQFIGEMAAYLATDEDGAARARDFHERWRATLGEPRQPTLRVVSTLFPTMAGLIGGRASAPDQAPRWSAERRICSDDTFSLYFQYSVDPSALSSSREPPRSTAGLTSAESDPDAASE